jgi:hypothetical protein
MQSGFHVDFIATIQDLRIVLIPTSERGSEWLVLQFEDDTALSVTAETFGELGHALMQRGLRVMLLPRRDFDEEFPELKLEEPKTREA